MDLERDSIMRAQRGSRIGEYVLLEKLGEGGFGEVWKARHNFFKNKVVAIKIPRDETYIKTLKNEGIIEHNMDNPRIVRILGFDPGHDPPYMVMEYVEGKSLREVLKEKGNMSVKDAVSIFEQLLNVLGYAHSKGVIHRDIKPENILIEPNGIVKLTDFGLGLVSEKVKGGLLYSGSGITATGKSIAGTAEYMSPEQRAGENVDQRTDIYSLGIMLFEMLTGQLPTGRDLPSGLNPAVPKYLDYIYAKCNIRLVKRYRSIKEIQKHLRKKEQLQRAIAHKPAPPPVKSEGFARQRKSAKSPPEVSHSQKARTDVQGSIKQADALMGIRYYGSAIAEYTKWIEIHPNDAEAYRALAWARYYFEGDTDCAIRDLDKAIEIDPEYGLAYVTRGLVRHEKGDSDGAKADWTEAIKIDPNLAQFIADLKK